MDHDIRRPAALVAAALLCSSAGAAGEPTAFFGFTAEQTAAQKSLESRFDSELSTTDLDTWLKNLASAPNQVGAPHDKANAEFVLEQFKQWGWDAQIEVFYPLYPTLKQHTLELVAPTKFVATLKEPPVEGDAT